MEELFSGRPNVSVKLGVMRYHDNNKYNNYNFKKPRGLS